MAGWKIGARRDEDEIEDVREMLRLTRPTERQDRLTERLQPIQPVQAQSAAARPQGDRLMEMIRRYSDNRRDGKGFQGTTAPQVEDRAVSAAGAWNRQQRQRQQSGALPDSPIVRRAQTDADVPDWFRRWDSVYGQDALRDPRGRLFSNALTDESRRAVQMDDPTGRVTRRTPTFGETRDSRGNLTNPQQQMAERQLQRNLDNWSRLSERARQMTGPLAQQAYMGTEDAARARTMDAAALGDMPRLKRQAKQQQALNARTDRWVRTLTSTDAAAEDREQVLRDMRAMGMETPEDFTGRMVGALVRDAQGRVYQPQAVSLEDVPGFNEAKRQADNALSRVKNAGMNLPAGWKDISSQPGFNPRDGATLEQFAGSFGGRDSYAAQWMRNDIVGQAVFNAYARMYGWIGEDGKLKEDAPQDAYGIAARWPEALNMYNRQAQLATLGGNEREKQQKAFLRDLEKLTHYSVADAVDVSGYYSDMSRQLRMGGNRGQIAEDINGITQLVRNGNTVEASVRWSSELDRLEMLANQAYTTWQTYGNEEARISYGLLAQNIELWKASAVVFNDDFAANHGFVPDAEEENDILATIKTDTDLYSTGSQKTIMDLSADDTAHLPNHMVINSRYNGSEAPYFWNDNRLDRYMSQEEIDIYNYYYNTQGPEAADQYLGLLKNKIDWAKRQDYEAHWAQNTNDSPVLATVFRTLALPASSLMSMVGDVTGAGPNSPWYYMQDMRQTIQGTVGDMIGDDFGVYWYDTLCSALDSTESMFAGAGIASPFAASVFSRGSIATQIMLQSWEAGSSRKNQLILNGVGETQAKILGGVEWALEFGSEMIGMEWTLSGIQAQKTILGKYARGIICGGIAEGLEEIWGGVGGIIAENLLLGDESQVNQEIEQRALQYMDEYDMQEGEACRRAYWEVYWEHAKEILKEMSSAGISGGVSMGARIGFAHLSGDFEINNMQRNGEINADQAQTLKAADRNAREALMANNPDLVDENLQAEAREIRQIVDEDRVIRENRTTMQSAVEQAADQMLAQAAMRSEAAPVAREDVQDSSTAEMRAQAEAYRQKAAARRQEEAAAAEAAKGPGLPVGALAERFDGARSDETTAAMTEQAEAMAAETEAVEAAEREQNTPKLGQLDPATQEEVREQERQAETPAPQLGTMDPAIREAVEAQNRPEETPAPAPAQKLGQLGQDVREGVRAQEQAAEEDTRTAEELEAEAEALEKSAEEMEKQLNEFREKGRKQPDITREELVKLMQNRAGMLWLDEEEVKALEEKAGALDYFNDRTMYGAKAKTETGADVTLDGFEQSGAKPMVSVKTEDGATAAVPLDSLDLGGSLTADFVYHRAAAYEDVDTARNYLAGAERTQVDPYNYDAAFQGLYARELSGRELTQRQKVAAAMLEGPVRAMIINAGRRARMLQAEKLGINGEVNQTMIRDIEAMPVLGKEGLHYKGVIRDLHGALSPTQRAGLTWAQALAEESGWQVIVTDRMKEHAQGKPVNGIFVEGTNRMIVDVTSQEGFGVLTALHEGWHFVKEQAKQSADFADAVGYFEQQLHDLRAQDPTYDEQQRIRDMQAAYRQAGQKLTEAQALEEINADTVRELLEYDTKLQTDVAQRLSRDERGQTVLERLAQVLDKWVNHAKNALRKLAGRSAEVRASRAAAEKDVTKITQMADYFRTLRQSAGRMYEMRQQTPEEKAQEKSRFSMDEEVETVHDLIAFHNVTLDNLKRAAELGALTGLSTAVSKVNEAGAGSLAQFGEISLLFDRNAIDPEANADNHIMSEDAYTITKKNLKQGYNVDERALRDLEKRMQDAVRQFPQEVWSDFWTLGKGMVRGEWRTLDRRGKDSNDFIPTERAGMLTMRLRNNDLMKLLYLSETGQLTDEDLHGSDRNRMLTVPDKVQTSDPAYQQWVRETMSRVIDTGREMVLDKNGQRKPATAAGIAEAMRSFNLRGSETMNPTMNVMASREYRSIGEVQADRARIGVNNEDRETKASDFDSEIRDSLAIVQQTLEQALDDQYGFYMGRMIYKDMMDAGIMQLSHGAHAMAQAMARTYMERIDNSGNMIQTDWQKTGLNETQLTDMIEDLLRQADIEGQVTDWQREAVGYAEAKLLRPVGFNEVKLALIPEGNAEYTRLMEQLRIPFETYTDRADRLDKMNQGAEQQGLLFSLDEESEDSILTELRQAQQQMNELRSRYHEIRDSSETQAWTERIGQAAKDGNLDEVVEAYAAYERESGLKETKRQLDEAEKRFAELNKAFDTQRERRATEEEARKIRDSGLDERDYRRKQAVQEFGLTTSFREAGYLMPDGKMLNFSGEKGRHSGHRGQDHRAIGAIYASDEMQGSRAMRAFMGLGNIRVMAETPGIDISTVMEPTAEQYSKIRAMAQQFVREDYFCVDLTDANGNNIGSLEYDGKVNPTRIVNDIKNYFRTGVIADTQNSLDRFRFSIEEADRAYMDAVQRGDLGTAQRMVDEAAKKAGYTIHAYHGTARGDRVGNVFRPDRATSGPMAFFTDNRGIAETYAKSKRDTSLDYDDEYSDYHTQFRVKDKNGKSISVEDLWNKMTYAQRARVSEAARHITFDDEAENIIYDKNAKNGNGGLSDYTVRRNGGNYIKALVETWLDDGNLFNEEERFLEVLKLAGIDNVEYMDPNAKHEKVYDSFLRIQSPFNTSEDYTNEFVDGLEKWWAKQNKDKYKKEGGYDPWDKNNITIEDWIDQARENIKEGITTAWTRIPDAVTDYLKSLGHDGIQDLGGKGGGDSHTVWIPFTSDQVKSAETVTRDDNGEVIPLSERFNPESDDIRFSLDEEAEAAADEIRYSFVSDVDSTVNAQMQRLLAETKRLETEVQTWKDMTREYREERDRLKSGVETARALSENEAMHELINQMTAEVNSWRGKAAEIDPKQIARMARDVRKTLETTMPFDDLRAQLTTVFEKMAKAQTPAEAKGAMQALSDLMMFATSESRHADRSMYDQYRDARKAVRSVKVTSDMLAEAGLDWTDFRNLYFGKIGMAQASVDGTYEELSGQYPEMFPPDVTSEGDRFARMIAFLDATEIAYYNPHTGENPENRGVRTAEYAASRMTMQLLKTWMADERTTPTRDQARTARIEQLIDRTMDALRQERGASLGGAKVWLDELAEQKRQVEEALRVSNFERDTARTRAKEAQTRAEAAERTAREAETRAKGAEEALETQKAETEKARQGAQEMADRARMTEREHQREIRRRADERRAAAEDRRKNIAAIEKLKMRMIKNMNAPSPYGFIPPALTDAVTKLINALDTQGEIVFGQNGLNAETLSLAKMAYEAIGQTDNGEEELGNLAAFYDPELLSDFDWLILNANEKKLHDRSKGNRLSDTDLMHMRKILTAFSHIIVKADSMFTEQLKMKLHEAGEAMIRQANDRIRRYGEHRVQGQIESKLMDALRRGLIKPVTAFGEYEGTELGKIWEVLRDGENRYIRWMEADQEAVQAIIDKYGMRDSVNTEPTGESARNDLKKRNASPEITLDSGVKLRMTDQERMTIWATAKREQLVRTNHLLGGGIVLANAPKGSSFAPIELTGEDLARIGASLTEQQKAFVDELVAYVTEAGKRGNEVSLALHGYEKYTEDYYIPLKSHKTNLAQEPGQGQDKRIKNSGFSKALTKNANTAIDVVPIVELMTGHMEEMNMYSALALPIQDMMRLMNYKEGVYDAFGQRIAASTRVRPLMRQAWGAQSVNFIDSFLSRLNGNGRMEFGGRLINAIVGAAKGAAVTGNLSVAMQQMGAGVRAMAVLPVRDVLAGMGNAVRFPSEYAELEKYAPIAVLKSWGYFDTNMRRGMYDRMRTSTWEKIKDASRKLAQWGDEINWAQIWGACKHEARRLNPGLSDEEIKQKAAKRFQEVIDKTQVVDSVFQRSEFATEKGRMAILMAFLSEPVTTYNMAYRAFMDWGRAIKSKEGVAKTTRSLLHTFGVIILSAVLTAALKSAVTGLRDRDNDKKDKDGKTVGRRTYRDKFMAEWGPNFVENLMGMGTIFTTMFDTIFQSYHSTGLEMQGLTYLARSVKELLKGEEMDVEKLVFNSIQGLSYATGVGFGSAYRDTKAIIDTFREKFDVMAVAANAYDRSLPVETRVEVARKYYAYSGDAKKPGQKVNAQIWSDLMVEAYLTGSDPQTVRAAAIQAGATEKGIDAAYQKKLAAAESRIPQAAQALADGDTETYNRLVTELADSGLGMDAIAAMIRKAYNGITGSSSSASAVKQRATTLLDENATAEDAQQAIRLYRQEGMDEKGIRERFTAQYKNAFVDACIDGDAGAQRRIRGILLTEGSGITAADLDKWTGKDLFAGRLYDQIVSGDTDGARATSQWLYAHIDGGTEAVRKQVMSWAKSRKTRGTETDWATVRRVLKALGYAEETINKAIGD